MKSDIPSDLTELSARSLADVLKASQASAEEVLGAYHTRIERINPSINAIISQDVPAAIDAARRIDARRLAGEELGPFAGLPIAIKDMEMTRGLRTTYGSPLFRDHVPTRDSLFVERLRAHGFIILGKTNTPEFAMGSHTFNTVFGATRNPWAVQRTAGGSSGGAAAAVAARMLPFADGSDLGGSLRNPGNYNHVVGLRPSPGRVPMYPSLDAWSGMGVLGPIARTVDDAAFLLAAMAGHDARDPLSIHDDPSQFLALGERSLEGVRVAFSPTWGGLPVERAVSEALRSVPDDLTRLGCVVEVAEPSFEGADEAFEVLRAQGAAMRWSPLLDRGRSQMKVSAIGNIEEGLALTSQQLRQAAILRTNVYQRMREFLERYDVIVGPVSQVAPFDIDLEYPRIIEGVAMKSYIEWMRSCSRITVTSHPSVSVPYAFTPSGLPVGLQVVGRMHGEFELLRIAKAIQSCDPLRTRRPPIA